MSRRGVSLGLAGALALSLLILALPAQAAAITHVVQPGENLFRIGLHYGVPWGDIMAANGLGSIFIYAGQTLIIPGADTTAVPAAPAANLSPTPATPAPVAPTASAVYMVQPGDTVFRIAVRYGTTVSALAAANQLYDARYIYAGQTLVIPGGAGTSLATPLPGVQLAVAGQNQALPLDCETRSAVDWAAYFGAAINEFEFFNGLPVSDDPEAGFVGSVYGGWGQLPPNPYGIHAGPVAARLRASGVKAQALRGAAWAAVRAELDAGRPVIAWVVGHVEPGTSYLYVAPSTGSAATVAPFEHTVIVSGYTAETVTVTDGAQSYARSLDQFLQSWGALGSQAISAGP